MNQTRGSTRRGRRVAVFWLAIFTAACCSLSGCDDPWNIIDLTVDGKAVSSGGYARNAAYCVKVTKLMTSLDGSVAVEEKGLGMTLSFPNKRVYVSLQSPANPNVGHLQIGVLFIGEDPVLCGDSLQQALRFAYPDSNVMLKSGSLVIRTHP